MRIKIQNYRNIPFEHPIEFELKDGITFVLGPNNVGKSNLLKFFFELRPLFAYSFNGNQQEISFKVNIAETYDQVVSRVRSHEDIIVEISNSDNQTVIYRISPRESDNLHSHSVNVFQQFNNVLANTYESRKLATDIFNLFSKTFYSGVFRTPEMIAAGNSFDLEIGSTFINNWIDWADSGHIQKMNKIKLLKNELKQIFGYNTFEIRTAKERNNLIITNDDDEFLLNELGSGISQFVLLLAKALFINPSFILIDEPENSLHPKLQETFVRALASKAKNGLLAASHSIGLARSVADQIYVLTREDRVPVLKKFGEHYEPTIAQSINEMGYSQYVEIGGNNILLVEGRTDVKTFREILRKYGIENKFIIISLGGGEYFAKSKAKISEELQELKRLNAVSVNVIFDSNKTSPVDILKEEQQVFKEVCECLGFNVFPTDRHSTENYLSQEAIEKVLGRGFSALKPYQNFNSLEKKWQKEKNWLIILEMNKEDFENTELNTFIEEILIPTATK